MWRRSVSWRIRSSARALVRSYTAASRTWKTGCGATVSMLYSDGLPSLITPLYFSASCVYTTSMRASTAFAKSAIPVSTFVWCCTFSSRSMNFCHAHGFT